MFIKGKNVFGQIENWIELPGPASDDIIKSLLPPDYGTGSIDFYPFHNGLELIIANCTPANDYDFAENMKNVLYLMAFSDIDASINHRTYSDGRRTESSAELTPDHLYVFQGIHHGGTPMVHDGGKDTQQDDLPLENEVSVNIVFHAHRKVRGFFILVDLDKYEEELRRRLKTSCRIKLRELLTLNEQPLSATLKLIIQELFLFSGNELAEELFYQCKTEEIIAILLTRLLSHEVSSVNNSSHRHEKTYEIEEVVTYLRDHIGEKCRLEDLARMFCMSTSKLTADFRDVTGMSIAEYRSMLRSEEARHLLLQTTLSQSEIAQALGFRSVSNFGDFFRKYNGMSPGAYRRKNK